MDNLTHSLVGWALGQAGLKRKTRKGLAALILGANMPDIDVFFGWVPWVPLATHRGFTHGLLGGVLLMPPMLAGLLWLLDRWQVRRGTSFISGLEMRFGWLLALSYLGALTHPLLDWQTVYAIQLLSPFNNHWYHTDGLFIIDLWILLTLGGAIALSIRRENRELPNWRRPPIVALAVVAVYIVVNAGISVAAKRALASNPPYPRADVAVASPPPVFFWRRELVWREERNIARGAYDPALSLAHLQSQTAPVPDGMDHPLARRALTATPEVVRFMRWSILPMAQVKVEGCQAQVNYNDARFSDGLSRNRFWISATIPTGDPACTSASGLNDEPHRPIKL
ncbi:metal-dependent hydrolase [Altererythrobacter sp. Root672]|uniref:metal-dependent hydrolase n=1 Tax=Altererythrobacter sp. Root672 TaxID=1736584 RepID=UPI000701FD87|nr:metal-dependent hydrolase [Altererythrobacter sp. Root672]KRA83181.1 metal-dependent hydrolase [Altererythrobacter sp. Root672]